MNIKFNKYIPWAAPLAGISDSPFRIIAKKFGAEIVFSEMVSTEGLARRQKNTIKMLKVLNGDNEIAMQFFGRRPEAFADSVQYLDDNYEYASMHNINAGCPVKKVVRNGCGVCLMKEPELIGKIVAAMKAKTQKPISVKIRSGLNENSINAIECAKIAESEGADFIIIHPRTATQMFAGHSDWSLIKQLKETIKIPVIGNGDISCSEHIGQMLQETFCDGVMIGRASIGNPWLFLNEKNKQKFPKKIRDEVHKLCLEHILLVEEYYGNKKSIGLVKKHIIQYATKSGFKNSEERRSFNDSICNAKDLDEQRKAIQTWASQ